MNKEELKLSPIRKKSSSSLLDDICGENTLCNNNGTTIEIDEENKENDILAKSANSGDSVEQPKKAEKEDTETQVDEEKSKKPKTLSRTSLLANFIAGCVNEQLKKNRKLKKNQTEEKNGADDGEEESETEEEDEEDETEEDDEENSEDDDESEDEDDDYEDEDDEEEDEADGEEEEFDIETNNGVGMENRAGYDSGCTAVVALLKDNKYLYVANAGDSRCVVCRDGKAVDMSEDHKPEDDLERKRIEKAGGQVTKDGRVNNGLNLSRAIGDHAYKTNKELSLEEQMITSLPDVRTLEIDQEKDSFMVLACDGIWNFMSSQEVCDYVQERLNANYSKLSQICEELFMHCLAPDSEGDGTGCDNMTCIIVTFKPFRKSGGKLNESLDKVNLKRSLEVKDAASDNSNANELISKKLKHDEIEMKLD